MKHTIKRGILFAAAASLSLAVLAAQRGARIIRTHDVQATADALAMWVAMEELGAQ